MSICTEKQLKSLGWDGMDVTLHYIISVNGILVQSHEVSMIQSFIFEGKKVLLIQSSYLILYYSMSLLTSAMQSDLVKCSMQLFLSINFIFIHINMTSVAALSARLSVGPRLGSGSANLLP